MRRVLQGLLRFASDEQRFNGRVAQLGERRPYKPEVTGSSPVPPTSLTSHRGRSSVWLERRPVTPEVASSSLVVPASKNKGLGGIDFVSPRKTRLLTVHTVKSLVISSNYAAKQF